jgi:cobalt/nickel transport system permease protein
VHIPDGILSAKVCIGGYGLASVVTWYALQRIQRDPDPSQTIPKASLLTAAFFIASSISIPIPPASVHLVLNGLLGALLGYYAIPAILVGLLFQAIMIGHGGLTTLGVNAVMMGVPAVIAYHGFQLRYPLTRWWKPQTALGIAAFGAGAIGIGLSALIFFALVITSIPTGFDTATERATIYGLTLAHLPLMAIEGSFTTLTVLFLNRVKPELFAYRGSEHEV